MRAKFYKILESDGGCLYAPKEWHFPIALDGEEVKNWESLVVELKDGDVYCHFQGCNKGANMVSQEMKDLLESFIGPYADDIEFLPVKAVSKTYGDRQYYIMHFKKIYDVIDVKNTVYIPSTGSIVKVAVSFEKVKDLKVFNTQPVISDVIVSEDVYKAIKKKKLDFGLEFWQVYCGD